MITIKWHKWLLGGFLGLIVLALFGCRGSHSSVYINDVSITPDPLVGQVVTLRVEVVSEIDAPDASINVVLSDGVNLVSGNLTWHGSLIADQPQTHELSICIPQPGIWEIITSTGITSASGITGADNRFFYIESGLEIAQVLTGEQYMEKYRDRWPQNTPTPLPVPIDVATTCIENGEE